MSLNEAGKKILIVDDQADFTCSMKALLEEEGYQVLTENSGGAALATARKFKPDLILLDILMPDKEGGAIAADLKKDPLLARVPIAFLTAMVSPEEAPKVSTGNYPFISKFADIRELKGFIDKVLPD